MLDLDMTEFKVHPIYLAQSQHQNGNIKLNIFNQISSMNLSAHCISKLNPIQYKKRNLIKLFSKEPIQSLWWLKKLLLLIVIDRTISIPYVLLLGQSHFHRYVSLSSNTSFSLLTATGSVSLSLSSISLTFTLINLVHFHFHQHASISSSYLSAGQSQSLCTACYWVSLTLTFINMSHFHFHQHVSLSSSPT